MDRRAALYALAAILIWSSLAVLGSTLTGVPSLLQVGLALSLSGALSLPRVREWRLPPATWAVGVGGIFGYHYLIFTSFKHAPVVEANLLNYLWPLLIVSLSPIVLPEYRLKPHHVIGTVTGFVGAALIVTGGSLNPELRYLSGYVMAAGAALTWALYSLLTKRVERFPTSAVGGFCMASGLLSLTAYTLSVVGKGAVHSLSLGEWVSIALLGLGPMGAAFFLWDKALKEGDPRVVGALSYLTPLLSTLWLVLLGGEAFTSVSGVAMLLLVAGSLIGSLDLLRGRGDSG
ncbi:DMT family transporter [Candidatus Bathyarchaeota archaeon]|nr:DMT family transporter [Candidatus Bathyarchaeota archaeon]